MLCKTRYDMCRVSLRSTQPTKQLILVGWVERSETQHFEMGSTQPTKNLLTTPFLSLRATPLASQGRHDRSNLIIDRGLLRRSFLTSRNDSRDSGFSFRDYLGQL